MERDMFHVHHSVTEEDIYSGQYIDQLAAGMDSSSMLGWCISIWFMSEGKTWRGFDRYGVSGDVRTAWVPEEWAEPEGNIVSLRSNPHLWSRVSSAGLLGSELGDTASSSDTPRENRVEPLLLHDESSHLRWFGFLMRKPPGDLPMEVLQARPTGRRPWGGPRTRRRGYISRLAWEYVGVPQEELLERTKGQKLLPTE